MSTEDIAIQIRQSLQKSRFFPCIRSVCLFGSYANGKAKKTSDIDLIVYFDNNDAVTLFDLSDLKHELTTSLHCPIDLITENGIKPHLKEKILNSSINVYQKS